jgi:PAS domain S-box-containing protein
MAPESIGLAVREVERVAGGARRPPFEVVLLSKAKDRLTLECHWRVVHQDGQPVGIQGTGRDVTHRKLAERRQSQLQAALEKSAMEWRMTFDAMNSPIVMLDIHGVVLRVNRAAQQLCGRDYREMAGQPVYTLGPESPWRKLGAMATFIRENRALEPVRTIDEDGEQTWEIEASPIAAPGMAEARILVVARDITAQVRLQESLRRSQTLSAMGSLVAGVAHEVRNPLFGISATLDAVERRFGDRLEFQPYGTVLRGELNRLTGLMQELLDYGRPRALTITRGSLEPAVDRAITACAALAEAAKVTVTKESRGWGHELELDVDRIAQVFQNLIENSIQHSPQGRAVTISARRRQEGRRTWIDCSVADSGPGFRPEDLPRLFDPFFSRRRGGTGLGLSIVQRILDQHGGHITASLRDEGGALMTVSLPVVAVSSNGEA